MFATLLRVDAEEATALWYAPGADLYVAHVDGDPDGIPVAALRHEGAEISFLVAPALQGRGHGRELLRAWLALHGAQPLTARAARENLRSRRTLAGAGFFESGLEHLPGWPSTLIRFNRRAGPG